MKNKRFVAHSRSEVSLRHFHRMPSEEKLTYPNLVRDKLIQTRSLSNSFILLFPISAY